MALHSVKQQIIRSFYPFGSTRKIRRGPLAGLSCRIAPGMGFTYIWGINQEQWTELSALAEPGDHVYDIGANCGQSTLHLAHKVGPTGKIIAFEPIPKNFSTLDGNIQLNKLSWVTPVCAALGAKAGKATFQFDQNQPTQAGFTHVKPKNDHAETIEVEVLCLDEYQSRGWPIPKLVKIDVEGGAADILAGGQHFFQQCRPVILFELHNASEQQAAKSLVDDFDYEATTANGNLVADPTTIFYPSLLLRPKS